MAFRRVLIILFFGLSLCASLLSTADNTSYCPKQTPIILGVLPFVSAEQLVLRFTPLANYLSKTLQATVLLETAPNYLEFIRRTHEDQRYDILFTAPHFYPQAKSKANYKLIASINTPSMHAVIAVPNTSNILTTADLTGKKIATIHPSGLATLLGRKLLTNSNTDPDIDVTLISTPSHDAAFLSSFHGITDASILMYPPFKAINEKSGNVMRVLAQTETTPQMPISISPHINGKCGELIKNTLLNIGTTDKQSTLLKLNDFSGFIPANDNDYDSLNDLFTY